MTLPVIQQIRAELPTVQLAYTFFSPSAEPFARSIGADFVAYLPFDRVATMRRAVAALRPTALVFGKLDVWPHLVVCAKQRGARLGLISASLPEQSSRRGVGSALTHDAYAALDLIGAVSETDAQHLVDAGAHRDHIRVTGDTRYDQAWHRVHVRRPNAPLVDALRRGRFTVVAGSTWPADEAVLFPAWEQVIASHDARLVIAPHEIDSVHLGAIEQWAAQIGKQCRRLDAPDAGEADIILVDRVGVLADLYAIATVAYVGGGFHRAGLHSVVEPAVLGVPVLIGPRHDASRDASLLLANGGAIAAHDAVALANAIATLATNPNKRAAMSTAASAVVSGELGAAQRSVEIVRELLGVV